MDDTTIKLGYRTIENILTLPEYVCNKLNWKISCEKNGALILNTKNSKTNNSKIIVGSKTQSIKAKMKYLDETLTNYLNITHHLKEKKTNIQSILPVFIYTTKNEILAQKTPGTLIKLYQATILLALLYGCETWYISREDIQDLTDIIYHNQNYIKTPNFNTKTSTTRRNLRASNRITYRRKETYVLAQNMHIKSQNK